jgi:hypothetical protein
MPAGRRRRKEEINKKQSIWWLERATDPINTKAVDRPVRHTASSLLYSMPMTHRTILLATFLNPNTGISYHGGQFIANQHLNYIPPRVYPLALWPINRTAT